MKKVIQSIMLIKYVQLLLIEFEKLLFLLS